MIKADIQILKDNSYLEEAYALVADAKDEILLSTYKLQLSGIPRGRRLTRVITQLSKAIQRGVKVLILIHYKPHYKGVPSANLLSMKALAAKGAEIRYVLGRRIIHAKLLIVDQKAMITGSHNWSINSMIHNFEISLLVQDSLAVSQARQTFLEEWERARVFK